MPAFLVRALPSYAATLALLAACSAGDDPPPPPRLKLWHTFNPTETEALNRALAERRDAVEVVPTLLPFARGQTILRQQLADGAECPDLARIDATWLPDLAGAGLLTAVPPRLAGDRAWLPEAAELVVWEGVNYGLPQSLDGLALIYRAGALREAAVRWPPDTLSELLAAARFLASRNQGYGLGVRVDGYWFAAFLRARGGDVLDPGSGRLGLDAPAAAAALEEFAELFAPGGVAPPPPPSGAEARDETRRFRAGELDVVVNGPWALVDLGGGQPEGLAVAPFPAGPDGAPAAPRGGHLFVVPRCAARAAEAWNLASELTAPALQAEWARRFGIVPTTVASIDEAGELTRQFYRALQRARPLPRHPVTAELFDDLNPAIIAVVAGDATAHEALAGVGRAWRRLMARHGLAVPDGDSDGDDEDDDGGDDPATPKGAP